MVVGSPALEARDPPVGSAVRAHIDYPTRDLERSPHDAERILTYLHDATIRTLRCMILHCPDSTRFDI